MFFLLYVPIVNQQMSPSVIDELAEQFAEQILKQAGAQAAESGVKLDTDEVPPKLQQELRAQIASIMNNMQLERPGNGDGQQEIEQELPAEWTPEKDFLERCYKKSA